MKTQQQEWIRVGKMLNLKTPTYRCNLCGRYIKVPEGKRPPLHCSCDTLYLVCREIMSNRR